MPLVNSLEKVFKRPLILGASVSADYKTESPGKRLALRYTTLDNIKVIAENGQTGQVTLSKVSPEILNDRTVVIGMCYRHGSFLLGFNKNRLARKYSIFT